MKRQIIIISILCSIFVGPSYAQKSKLEQTINDWQFCQVGKTDWHPAKVPGCIHSDLMSNKLIPDPYFRDNEKKVQWIEDEDWEYRTDFDVSPDVLGKKEVQLTFEGLDTYADIYLNGLLLLNADNMYRNWTVDCKKLLKEKNNNLRVLFHSAVKEGFKKASNYSYWLPIHTVKPVNGGKPLLRKADTQTRKAPYQFGWDTHPRLVTCGIWKPVILTAWSEAKIDDVYLKPVTIEKDRAHYQVQVQIATVTQGDYHLSVFLDNGDKPVSEKTFKFKKGENTETVDLAISNPRLWWPNGMGKQNLYTVKVELSSGNNVIDKKTHKLGVRTIEVVQEKDSIGQSFYFRVNGVPVFIKGSNHVPTDALVTNITDSQYKNLISAARDAHMNMLRVWGGAIYENDIFYDLCDEAGIMVWQDFMFACAMYPGDQAFLDNVKMEVIDNVKRLRNHPSMALWSGNNEIIQGWNRWLPLKAKELNITKKDSAQMFHDYLKIFEEIIPDVIHQYDPQMFYWSSSPQSAPGVASTLDSGDYHYYKVWHGREPLRNYQKVIPRFMDEYGVQSLPTYYTLHKYLAPEDEYWGSPVMAFRQKDPSGDKKMEQYLHANYREPKDFQSMVYLSQVFQADAIKMASEVYRINKPRCMGTMYWQFGDSWPNIGWSVIDYLGQKKAAYYITQKAYANILVIPALSDTAVGPKTRVNVYINSDSTAEVNGKLQIKLLNFSGKQLFFKELYVKVGSLSNEIFFTLPTADLLKGHDKKYLVLSTVLTTNGKVISSNLLFFDRTKYLVLQKPDIFTKITGNGSVFEIELSANTLAKDVCLMLPGGEDGFSDNFFDLLPNEKVKIGLNTKLSAEELRNKLIVYSMVDFTK